ncbi:MAG: fibrinogen-like YCDxxxxGGGW domain-containing protein [Nannocystaceae bacterium]
MGRVGNLCLWMIVGAAAPACGGDESGSAGATESGTTTTTTTATTATTSTGTMTTTGSMTGTASESEGTTVGETTAVATATTEAPPDPVCGDGEVNGTEEECDDGAGNADDGPCTAACKVAVCGDGLIEAGIEACDDGAGNADDAACTSMCELAVCGDGLVQAGVEACDDGNDDNSDGCVDGCVAAACGDGFLGPGEACDDGNQVDDDSCTNECALASCGDAKVQMGEECDDGNAVETDACLSTCLSAACGDGVVQEGVEACDDGNNDDKDACTAMCQLPACDDKIEDGDETDVDCGGAICDKCAQDQKCVDDGDCMSGNCVMGKCGVPTTCKALKAGNPGAASGVYTLDPDGSGPIQPFQAYCEMTFDGGGWTLALKADGSKTTFAYDQGIWLNNSLVGANFPDLDHNEAKLATWNSIAFTDLLVGLEYPIGNGPVNAKLLKVPLAGASLFARYNLGAFVATSVGRAAWKTLVANASLQPNCNTEGLNSHPSGNNAHTRARLGIVSNQENDCASPDSFIGIGTAGTPCGGAVMSAGNMSRCTGDNGDVDFTAFGVVFVR